MQNRAFLRYPQMLSCTTFSNKSTILLTNFSFKTTNFYSFSFSFHQQTKLPQLARYSSLEVAKLLTF